MSVTLNISRIGFICILLKICIVDSTIDIFDHFGRKVDSFQDREAIFDDDELIAMEGYILAADPPDACNAIAPPPFLSNFTVGRFVLINGTESQCGLTKKVINAKVAGYDLAVIFDPFPMPFEYLHVEASYPNYEQNIQVVFISFMDGISIRDNYLYNNSYEYNFKVRIKPNTPDITYYMYLFGAVIGVCFFVMLLFMMCLLIKCIQERRRRRRNRLSSRQIKQIPTTKFSKGDQYDVCAICLEDYNEGDKLRLLPCSHAYHAKCIDPWLMNNRRNCPLCKRKITFGDSGDESDSDDSELTSPAENTPLLTSPTHRAQSWGTFAINPVQTSSNSDGSGPSSLPSEPMMRVNRSFVPDSSTLPKFSPLPSSGQILSDDESESLLPPPQLSVNRQNAATSTNAAPVEVNFVLGDSEVTNDANGHRGLIV